MARSKARITAEKYLDFLNTYDPDYKLDVDGVKVNIQSIIEEIALIEVELDQCKGEEDDGR